MLNMRLEDQAGDVLKKFRYGRKKSLRDAAQESGLSPDLLRSLEGGDTAPTFEQLVRLGDTFGFDGAAMAGLHLHPEATPDVPPPALVLPILEDFGGYPVWCTLVRHPNDRDRALLVDTGGGGGILRETIRAQKIKLDAILLTHGHGDHGGGFQGVAGPQGIPVFLSRQDFPLLPEASSFKGELLGPKEGCGLLSEKGWSVSTHPAPGHTPGSVAYLAYGTLFVGDTLFCGSAGKSVTPDEFSTQLASIRGLLEWAPPDTVILSGHGPLSTVGDERRHNPFVRVRENPFWR